MSRMLQEFETLLEKTDLVLNYFFNLVFLTNLLTRLTSQNIFHSSLWIPDSLFYHNPSRSNPGQREKINLNFYFHFSVVPRKVLFGVSFLFALGFEY